MVGEQGEQSEFVDNTLELDDIPQIELPFRDDVSNDLKNLLRALVINQQNMINNTTFLYDRLKDLSRLVSRIARELPPSDPRQPDNPPNSPVLPPITEEAWYGYWR